MREAGATVRPSPVPEDTGCCGGAAVRVDLRGAPRVAAMGDSAGEGASRTGSSAAVGAESVEEPDRAPLGAQSVWLRLPCICLPPPH